jgi:molybdopterin synthase sulfur carrier subunit
MEFSRYAGQDYYPVPPRNEALEVKVHVTEMLVRHLNARPEFTVDAKNLGALLDAAEGRFQGFRDSVCDETGRIRVYVNVFVNGELVTRDPEALSIPLSDGDEVYVLASVAGGRL